MNKYRNQKVTEGDQTFDSQGEYYRWKELQMLEKAGEISNLRRQVRFELLPIQREPSTIGKRGAVIQGKVLEYPIYYRADFVYQEGSQTIVEDFKGMVTKDFIIKRKLMLYKYGIRIRIAKGRG